MPAVFAFWRIVVFDQPTWSLPTITVSTFQFSTQFKTMLGLISTGSELEPSLRLGPVCNALSLQQPKFGSLASFCSISKIAAFKNGRRMSSASRPSLVPWLLKALGIRRRFRFRLRHGPPSLSSSPLCGAVYGTAQRVVDARLPAWAGGAEVLDDIGIDAQLEGLLGV